ncbi:MAG: hypothetical protein J6O51_08945 [Bacteroidales bacterium]|nr:hypothetical protein [Bacteroidales bacterium]
MKRLIICLALAAAAAACTKNALLPWNGKSQEEEDLAHDMIVLGEQLPDPYSVTNMSKALQSIVPAGAGRTTLDPTDYYVRFLPKDEQQLQALVERGLELIDHPLDYRIVKDGDWYHDPSLPEGDITWQYAVVPVDFSFPKGIRYERLDDCFIAEHNPATKSDGIDWEAVEREAFRLTGNDDMLLTKADAEGGTHKPEGRIAIMDPGFDEEPVGVKGVKVCCNAFVKFSTCFTDEEGYYKMGRSFSSNVRYRLVFQNVKGFCQGINLIIVPASTSALGKSESTGLSIVVDNESERKLLTRCAVNNAGYDYLESVRDYPDALPTPPKDLRIWNLQMWNGELPLMLHQGVLIDTYEPLKSVLGEYTHLVKIFPPDVVIGCKGAETYADIYALALHAFAHGGHFSLSGKDWWSNYSEYAVKSLVSSAFHNIYGARDDDGCSYCEVAENYAFYCQSALYKRHYKESSAIFGTSYWFSPQLLMFLDERGLGLDKLPPLFTPEVIDMTVLHDKLLSYYPSFKGVINEAFTRYGNE